jgi:hypothetical protein
MAQRGGGRGRIIAKDQAARTERAETRRVELVVLVCLGAIVHRLPALSW